MGKLVLQCVAVCCSVLQCVANGGKPYRRRMGMGRLVLQYVAACCSMLQCCAMCCSVLQ